jgi:hypothetical protein
MGHDIPSIRTLVVVVLKPCPSIVTKTPPFIFFKFTNILNVLNDQVAFSKE